MSLDSIASHSRLLEATAARMRQVFGELVIRVESAIGSENSSPIRSLSESRLETRSTLDLLQGNPPEAVEKRLKRLGFSTEVIRRVNNSESLEGRIDSGKIGLERIIGRNELLAVRYLDAGRLAGRAVARIVVRASSGAILGYGTGSMISPSLLMTNNHVIGSIERAAHAVVEFNYELGLDGRELPAARFRLRPDLFFTTSPEEELDLTLVAVSDVADVSPGVRLSAFGFNSLSTSDGEILAGESVTVIQHPGGELKQVALRENRVIRFPGVEDRFLYYETDTTPGSSGAPVFNDQWEVVALHHSGFPERDGQGRILTTDGQLWRKEMGDERIRWIANEGIRIAAIRKHLAELKALTSEQGIMRDRALNPQPVPPEPLPERHPVQVSIPGNVLPASTVNVVAEAVATWTIPLTVTVKLGAQPDATHCVSSPTVASKPHQNSVSSVDVRLLEEPEDSDFEVAKRFFEESRNRPYYDATSDEADRAAYYSNVSTSLNPSQLYDKLSELVQTTHRNALGYKPAVHLYPWVDLQPNLKIRSIYSSQLFEPLELIRRDIEVSRLRRERIQRFQASEGRNSPAMEGAFLESLESEFKFNCEHVVPQSWFRERQPMRGDLHHLFACESKCNSFRGNTPYFEFANFGEAIRSDCGKSETNKFEPNAGKGAVARATLYFLLRYPGEINSNSTEYTPDRIKTLIEWHQDHPVTDYERHRNQAIFAVQGNRNPLIDFPANFDKIDFARGLG